MNADLQKNFVIRLGVVCLVAIAARYVLTMPRVAETNEREQFHRVHQRSIEEGWRSIERYGSEVDQKLVALDRLRTALFTRYPEQESTQAHKAFQSAAEKHDLVVSRLEPLNRSIVRGESAGIEDAIQVEKAQFRVECQGRFADVVGFVADLETAPSQVSITSFRLTPIDAQEVRAIMQIRTHHLLKVPEPLRSAAARTESPTGGADAGY